MLCSLDFFMAFNSKVSLFNFCLDNLFIGESIVLKSSTISLLELICDFRPISVSFMKLGVPLFGSCIFRIGVYMFRILIILLGNFPLASMKYPSLFLLTSFSLKSVFKILE